MEKPFPKHPCFDREARETYSRIHLPVAPSCNVQCNFCNRKYDCQNESRPGVTSTLLTPSQAIEYLKKTIQIIPNISVVGIAGPGDPFNDPELTLETLQRVRSLLPDVYLCVATNGLNLAPYVIDLMALKVSHVTITINAINPSIGAKIYAWIRKDKRIYRKETGAEKLIINQMAGLKALSAANITTKINTVVMPGINHDHVVEIAKTVKKKGAHIMNCVPVYPVKGAKFEDLAPPKRGLMADIQKEVKKHLPLMSHCARCRADAAGLISCKNSEEVHKLLVSFCSNHNNASKPFVAVASREGLLINQHLGEARSFWIFEATDKGFTAVGRRPAPQPGGGDARWKAVAMLLQDCRALLVSDLGTRPKTILEAAGLPIFIAGGIIEQSLTAIYQGKEIRWPKQPIHECKSHCSGDGMGCG